MPGSTSSFNSSSTDTESNEFHAEEDEISDEDEETDMQQKTYAVDDDSEQLEEDEGAAESKAEGNTQLQQMSVKRESTAVMVVAAIRHLNNRPGSSLYAIKKYILDSHPDLDEKRLTFNIKKYLKKALLLGELVQTKGTGAVGSFKLPAGMTAKKEQKIRTKQKAKTQTKAKQQKSKEEPTPKLKATAKKTAAADNNNNNNNNKENKLPQKPKTKSSNKLKVDKVTEASTPKKPKTMKKSPMLEETQRNTIAKKSEELLVREVATKRKLYRKSINLVVNPLPQPKVHKKGHTKKAESSKEKMSVQSVETTKSRKKKEVLSNAFR